VRRDPISIGKIINVGDCITTGLGRKFSDPHCLAEQG
jgi:hypothetical protein